MQGERREKEFLQACLDAGKRILEMDDAVVVHHFDADGLSAGAILFSAMLKNGIAPSMQCWKKTTSENVLSLKNRKEKQVVIADLAYNPLIVEHLQGKEVIILDHHEIDPTPLPENITLVNGHNFGIDGATEVSGGGTSYLAFRNYKELSQLALVSAVGDMQDKDGQLKGINQLILKDAVTAGIATVKKDLKMFGKGSRSLISFLSYCTDPYLPELTGNDKNCARFLQDNGIAFKQNDKYISYYDLSEDGRKQFASALIEYCTEKQVPEQTIASMIGDVIIFEKEEKGPFYEAHEFATLMNACGRNNAAEVGIKACLGSKEARQAAFNLYEEHRRNLRSGITLARNKISDVGEFYLLDCRGQVKDAIIGIVAGALAGSADIVHSKPVIALSIDEDDAEMVKLSARATNQLVANGIDLNAMLRRATLGLGKSIGGGHKVAAGASVEKKYLPEFLKRCAEFLKEQNTRAKKEAERNG